MDLINKLLGVLKRNKINEIYLNQSVSPSGTPIKSDWLLTHKETISNEFSFLETEMNFNKIKDGYSGHEYWVIYVKKHIEVQIWGDHGDLPYVLIKNKLLPYSEPEQLDNRDDIEDFNSKAKQLRVDWRERKAPIQERFMDDWLKKDSLDHTESTDYYERFGKEIHIEFLRETAKTVRENIELKKGKLNKMI